ncbi:nitroreductase family protein [Floccifex sp.]|uniref:nitroreductase family protein n=1 Tax=Floccifex sp. TaxID=2815810 RepID=UPI003F043D8E
MEFKQITENRKSIRSYEKCDITKDEITEMIQCAQLAPSWKNSQTTRFYVVTSQEMLEKMKTNGLSNFNTQRTLNVSVYIVIAFEKNISGFNEDGTPTNEMGQGWGYYDAGIATNQLLLKATEMGYGTLVMGIRDEQTIRENLQIPSSQIITAVISVGKPKVIPERNPRKEVEDVLKWV